LGASDFGDSLFGDSDFGGSVRDDSDFGDSDEDAEDGGFEDGEFEDGDFEPGLDGSDGPVEDGGHGVAPGPTVPPDPGGHP
jgi:hypothetical protein